MIELSRVCQRFGGRRILHEVDHVFASNTVHILRGPSGAGKSSLLNLVAGYLKPDSGTVRVAAPIGYLMQEELLFSQLTVAENLTIRCLGLPDRGGSDLGHRITTILHLLSISHIEQSPVADLSGGERRRVEIAGMLLGDPKVLLLDEPTANLDPVNAANVYAALWKIQPGRTMLIVTHEADLPSAPESAVRLVLDDGRVHEQI